MNDKQLYAITLEVRPETVLIEGDLSIPESPENILYFEESSSISCCMLPIIKPDELTVTQFITVVDAFFNQKRANVTTKPIIGTVEFLMMNNLAHPDGLMMSGTITNVDECVTAFKDLKWNDNTPEIQVEYNQQCGGIF